ncbi:MAG TPA: hypothetical protein VJ904_06275, partial [Tichowtungia sp.]|nr:hypothetical protein [Tichowtungia sp.]
VQGRSGTDLADANSGSFSGKIGGWDGDDGILQLTGHTIADGEEFTLTFRARNAWGDDGGNEAVLYYDSPANVISTLEYTASGSFAEYTLTATAAAESAGGNVGIRFEAGNNFLQLDDVSLSVEGSLEGYALWADGYGVGAGTNDFDSDGINNLYEYAMDGNPANGLPPANLPVFSKVGNGFLYVHPQRSDDASLLYTVETSTNLITGAWTNTGVVAIGTNLTGDTLNFVANEVDAVENEKFIRLRIEQ